MSVPFPLTIIGTTDYIDLPEFKLYDVACKIDTGADTSTIHCSGIKLIEKNDKTLLRFKVLDHKHPAWQNEVFEYNEFTEKTIRSSFGDAEKRYVIRTRVVIFNRSYPIFFTLSDRKKMRFPILIGKRFLKQHFLVDVNQKDLSFNMKTITANKYNP